MADEKVSAMGKVGQTAGKGDDIARGMSKAAETPPESSAGSKSGPSAPGASTGSAMGKVGQATDKSEEIARGMSRAATSATNTMADAGARASRDMGQAAQSLTSAGASAARTMGQAAAGAMGAMGDFSKMFEGLRMPAVPDMDLMLGAYRRNLEALSTANRVALEGAQQIARRNMEIMQQTMGEMTDAMRGLTSSESPQDRAGKQTEMLKGAYERAIAHMRELADLIQRSNGEALEVLNQRFAEAMDEARAMVEKARG